jgi:methionine-rich copper-binding protein CopC
MHFSARVMLAAFLAGALWTSSAQAHAILVESQPAVSSKVAPGEVVFRLRYNSRIDRARSRVSLMQADAADAVLPIGPGDPPDMLTTHATLQAGAYTLRWQVLAIDGHITRGDLPFTVAPSGK